MGRATHPQQILGGMTMSAAVVGFSLELEIRLVPIPTIRRTVICITPDGRRSFHRCAVLEKVGSMDQNEVAMIFNDSYERVMRAFGKSGEFFSAFYALLIASSPEAANKFRDTDMAKQVQMVRASVAIMVAFYGKGVQDDYLLKLAERHSKRGADIAPRLYSVWMDCLLETVRRFDSKFNDDVATAWRSVLSKGIEFMTSSYEKGEEKLL
jgi:hemoglobin-like flavoprotein